MKKFKHLLLAAVAVAGSMYISSCKKSDDASPAATRSISFVSASYSSGTSGFDTNAVTPNVAFAFKFTVKGSAGLKSITVKRTDLATATDSTIVSENYTGTSTTSKDLNITGKIATGDLKYVITATDQGSVTVTRTFTLKKYVAPANTGKGTYTEKTGVSAGAQQSTTGSFYNAGQGLVYSVAEAKTNSAMVDFGFFVGATKAATVFAPSSSTAEAIFGTSIFTTDGLQNWGTRNSTKLWKIDNTLDYSAPDSSAISSKSAAVTGTDIFVSNLAVGDVVAFQTADGSNGLVKIKAIPGPYVSNQNTGNFTFDVKTSK